MEFLLVTTLVGLLVGGDFGFGQEVTSRVPDGGENSILPYIIQGTDAATNAYPYLVSLQDSGAHRCGGSIVTQNYVVTAAHCVVTSTRGSNWVPQSTSTLSVRVGSVLRSSGGRLIGVSRIIPHSRYRNDRQWYDIALIRLASPVSLGASVAIIPIARSPPPIRGEILVLGWGQTTNQGRPAERLQYLRGYATNERICRAAVNAPANSLLCFQSNRTSGICYGDSGSAAVYRNTLVGVASFLFETRCGTSNPDGYVLLSYHLDWLRRNSDLS